MAQSLDQFVAKWGGKPCDFDHGGTYECVDIVRQWIQDGLGLPGYSLHALGAGGYAKNLYNNFNSADAVHFVRIANSTHPNNQPVPGDIIVFKTSLLPPFDYGIAGHTGVVMPGTTGLKVVVFNQNYPTHHLCQPLTFSYKDCLGWIRRK